METIRHDLPAYPVRIELPQQVAEQRFSSRPTERGGEPNFGALPHQGMRRCQMAIVQRDEQTDVSGRRAGCGELAHVISDAVASRSQGGAEEKDFHRAQMNQARRYIRPSSAPDRSDRRSRVS